MTAAGAVLQKITKPKAQPLPVIWDDDVPVRFLLNLHKKHRPENQRVWMMRHEQAVKRLVYAEVNIHQLQQLHGHLTIYPGRILYWQSVLEKGDPFGVLYCWPSKVKLPDGLGSKFAWRVMDGNHRRKVLLAAGIDKVRIAYDPERLKKLGLNGLAN